MLPTAAPRPAPVTAPPIAPPVLDSPLSVASSLSRACPNSLSLIAFSAAASDALVREVYNAVPAAAIANPIETPAAAPAARSLLVSLISIHSAALDASNCCVIRSIVVNVAITEVVVERNLPSFESASTKV